MIFNMTGNKDSCRQLECCIFNGELQTPDLNTECNGMSWNFLYLNNFERPPSRENLHSLYRIDLNLSHIQFPSSTSSLTTNTTPNLQFPPSMAKIPSIIEQYRPSLYVLASQVVAATLNAAAKFIETTDEAVHPFMILYVRMLITTFGCTVYLLLSRTPNDTSKVHMLLGTHDVRWLLVLRALGGICSATGFFCMYSWCEFNSHPLVYQMFVRPC